MISKYSCLDKAREYGDVCWKARQLTKRYYATNSAQVARKFQRVIKMDQNGWALLTSETHIPGARGQWVAQVQRVNGDDNELVESGSQWGKQTHTGHLASASLTTALKSLDSGQYAGARVCESIPGEAGEETYLKCQPGAPQQCHPSRSQDTEQGGCVAQIGSCEPGQLRKAPDM